jgi:uncharacterized protein YjbJ (UPF0337 family)
MNWEQIEGKWKQFKGAVKQKWGKLTDDDLDFIAGKRDQLVGKIQERYGVSKEKAYRQIEDWNPKLPSEGVPKRERKVS